MKSTVPVALVVLAAALAIAYALRLPEPAMRLWLGLGLPYLALASLAAVQLFRKGVLRDLLRFRPGDLTLGIGLGGLLLVSAWGLSRVLFPLEAPGHAWLFRIFLLAGDTSTVEATFWLIVLGACDELTWRGWVQLELSTRLGVRRGWVACAVLYAVAHTPTLVTLSDPVAGPNPVLVLLALGCGLCWAFLRERTGRVMPSLLSHVAFTYLAAQYLWRFV